MDVPQSIRDSLKALNAAAFQELVAREFKPALDLIGLKYLREKAGNEEKLRELYRGRALYELLQNADDAGAGTAAFILAPDGIAFAHDGRWFTVENFRSLADGWSDKDPDTCIGHKGLGFRSVLDITPSPFLADLRADSFFGVKFTYALNWGHIQQAFQKDPGLRSHYEAWTRHRKSACPVMAIPGLARKPQMEGGAVILDKARRDVFGAGFTTLFWFPAADPDIPKDVLEALSPMPMRADSSGRASLAAFIEGEVSTLLPFLRNMRSVDAYGGDTRLAYAKAERVPHREHALVTVDTGTATSSRRKTFLQLRKQFAIPVQVLSDAATPKALKGMRQVSITLSMLVAEGQPRPDRSAHLHVYFPTEELTGLGFVVHGDFFVKPDRTRLMSGAYNDWLLDSAARLAADEFLTLLLESYEPRAVFGAFGTTGPAVAGSATLAFVERVRHWLAKRAQPFVPSSVGLLPREQVLVPPNIDSEGFWGDHFEAALSAGPASPRLHFLRPDQDGPETRQFLRFAAVPTLDAVDVLDFIERSADGQRPLWWLDCYRYLADSQEIDRSDVVGRSLIRTLDGVVEVQSDAGLVISLPPSLPDRHSQPPELFANVFVFVHSDLATLLREDGAADVLKWVEQKLNVSPFEPSALLTRVVRAVVPKVYAGVMPVTRRALVEAWGFLEEAGRAVGSMGSAILAELGRFPVPVDTAPLDDPLNPKSLAPVCLTYWPESRLPDHSPLIGVPGLRRLSEAFIGELTAGDSQGGPNALSFLAAVGVSSHPKALHYSRVVGDRDVSLVDAGVGDAESGPFSGDRQRDVNRAVRDVLRRDGLWPAYLRQAARHHVGATAVLHSLRVVEGLKECSERAVASYAAHDEQWHSPLHDLPRHVASVIERRDDAVAWRGKSGTAATASYVQLQVRAHSWLATSMGPRPVGQAFARRVGYHLIAGKHGEALGDRIVPYVVVDSLDRLAALEAVGVPTLEESSATAAPALIEALVAIGESLGGEWGQRDVIGVPTHWRHVRAALQDIYRQLNSNPEPLDVPADLKLAARLAGSLQFRQGPICYAEPGSIIEQAFRDDLPLLDADRAYATLFDALAIIRLVRGENVQERMASGSEGAPSESLRAQLLTELGPHLLAAVIAKSERATNAEQIARRLRDRFEVRVAPEIIVEVSIQNPTPRAVSIPLDAFYLRVERTAADRPSVLYVKGGRVPDLYELDGDALGVALTPLFVESHGGEIASLFPRIAGRVQSTRGNLKEVRRFLHTHLAVSLEAQDHASFLMSGETPSSPPPPPTPESVPSPPPPVVTDAATPESWVAEKDELLEKHRAELEEKAGRLLARVTGDTTVSGGGGGGGSSPEQREQGREGEDEIKRRLELDGGWGGMTLSADKRDDRCGYDFLCSDGERMLKLEVKTFSVNGRLMFTALELQEAASSDNYILVGVLATGEPPYAWPTYMVRNPIVSILSRGHFWLDARLQVPAAELFDLI